MMMPSFDFDAGGFSLGVLEVDFSAEAELVVVLVGSVCEVFMMFLV